MTLLIVVLLIFAFLLISTTHITGVNKAAVAMLMCTLGWVLYICWGTDFVRQEHLSDYETLLTGIVHRSTAVKEYIYANIFLKYVGRAAAIVLFLLATMTIVEILNNNGCFDFVQEWVGRRRVNRSLLWRLTLITFVLSANIESLSAAVLMLVIMRNIVRSRRQRMLIGSAIVLAANSGGCFTVIGDPTGLLLWGDGDVWASDFSLWLAAPAVMAWVVPTLLIQRELPRRLDTELPPPVFRGDDTRLNRWQRLMMLVVGIGGLWSIPTFHSITRLSPFLGALCVLAILWIVNEAFNRKLLQSDQSTSKRVLNAVQYGSIQQMLFVMGITLGMGVMTETGVLHYMASFIDSNVNNIWVTGITAGVLSSVVDTFTMALTHISLYDTSMGGAFALNGIYWKIIAYSTAVGGCLLVVGSASGLALMKMEHMRPSWYLRFLTPKILLGYLIGFLVLWMEQTISSQMLA